MLAIRIMKPRALVKALWFTLLLAGCFADQTDLIGQTDDLPNSNTPTVIGIQILDAEQKEGMPSEVRFRVINNLDRGICVREESFDSPLFLGIYVRDRNGKMLKPEPEGIFMEQDFTSYRLDVNASRTAIINFSYSYICSGSDLI